MRAILVLMVSLLAGARAAGAWAQVDLPDLRLTPGALNPGVTQENIGDTICMAGWTRTVRRIADRSAQPMAGAATRGRWLGCRSEG